VTNRFDQLFGPGRGVPGQGIAQRALKGIAGMAAGDTCFLCEVGSKWVVRAASKRSVRADGVGTCERCHVHACPQHGDRYGATNKQTFRCADCLSVGGAATAAGVGNLPGVPAGADDEAGGPQDAAASRVSTQRLLAANDVPVEARAADRLRLAIQSGSRRPLPASLQDELTRTPEDLIWRALGLPRPEQSVAPDTDLTFDPRDARQLAWQQLSLFEEVAGDIRGTIAERAEMVDWRDLSLFIVLPIAVRRGNLGDTLLAIPGGLTLPPIIAVLAQAYADARARQD
jgi:hypothetical protein